MTMSSHIAAPGTSLGTGIGLRAPHHAEIMARRPDIGFLEIHAENYMGGGWPVRVVETLRRDYAFSVHGVGLSLGGADGIDADHLERLARLCQRIEPALVSEHLAWNRIDGTYLNDLLPLPYTVEALDVVARNVDMAQARLGRPLLIENPTVYMRLTHEMSEPEFLTELVRRTGCRVLCDVNNIYVNARNHGTNPLAYLKALPPDAVGEIHLAGHCVNDADGTEVWIDDHGAPVAAAVWDLYGHAVRRFPAAATLIEWDSNLPALDVLLAEAKTARMMRTLGMMDGNSAHAA